MIPFAALYFGPLGTPEEITPVAEEVAERISKGERVAVLLCGAPAWGFGTLPADAPMSALTAVGLPLIMQAWEKALAVHGLRGAQVMASLSDILPGRNSMNAINTLNELFASGIVPLVTVTGLERV